MLVYLNSAGGEPEIVPKEAEIVKEIYHSYLTGMSLQQIADSLNARRIATKGSNAQWKNNKILNILTNEKYTGDALLQKTYIIDCISKKSRKNNGELPMYLVKKPSRTYNLMNRIQSSSRRNGSPKE